MACRARSSSESSSSFSEMRHDEYFDILAKRVVYSRAHSCLCGTMILAGVAELSWILLPNGGIGQLPEHPCFVLLETYVTLGLLVEIALRAVLQRRAFLQRWSNLFDCLVVLVSVLSSALFAAGLETPAEMAVLGLVVTGRVAFRLLRLLALTKTFQQHQQAAMHLQAPFLVE